MLEDYAWSHFCLKAVVCTAFSDDLNPVSLTSILHTKYNS